MQLSSKHKRRRSFGSPSFVDDYDGDEDDDSEAEDEDYSDESDSHEGEDDLV